MNNMDDEESDDDDEDDDDDLENEKEFNKSDFIHIGAI